MNKKAESAGWRRRYGAALRKHLEQGPGASLQPARGLGREAVALGLETLDVARCHAQALLALAPADGSSRIMRTTIGRANGFFAEAMSVIEKTHHAALESAVHIHRLSRMLHQRTAESSASFRLLKRTVIQRQEAEAALRKSQKHHASLLAEAHRLQKHLRHLTRQILSAHENEQRKMSSQLHDEIAQTLLGIHVQLLTLKRAAKFNAGNLKKEIADTQQLVEQSAQKVKRFAHEFFSRREI